MYKLRTMFGRMEIAALALVAALLLLVAKGNSQCPQGLPLFGGREPHNELPDKIQAILPTYTFTCSGQVVQWGACVQPQGRNERYDIYFQVWRSTGDDGCYSIVGSNFIADGDPDIPRGCIVFDVPEDQRFTVEAGDVMGFYSDHNRDRGGLDLDTDVDLDVWYRTLSNPTLSDLEDGSLCVGANQDLGTLSSDSGAPILTAVVDNSQCLSSVPLFGDRDRVSELPDRIQAIIPAYRFTCRGQIVQWGACVDPHDQNYDIYFQVWRPTGASGCYSLVGSNFVDNGNPGSVHNVRRCVVLDVPENEQITVEPGDVVGFHSTYAVESDGGGVELDEGADHVVWYSSQNSPDTNPVCTGVSGDLSSQRNSGAPVITAMIELVSAGEQSQSGHGGIIGGIVPGLLVVVAVVVLIALAILYNQRKCYWYVPTPHSVAEVKPRTHTQAMALHNPLYTGVLSHSTPTNTAEKSYEDPDHQTLDNNYEVPERRDIDHTKSNVPLVEQRYGSLLDTHGHCKWSIYVPTQEQRRAVAFEASSDAIENIYAALGEVQHSQDSVVFFESGNVYWKPSSNPNKLFDQLAINKYREIPRNLIQTTEHLGSGQFGSVEKGIWQTKTGAVEVAVKTLKAGASQDDEVRFLQEAAINGQFKHPNIVKLLGVATVGEPVMIVLELLSNGDLRNYLIKQQPAPGELLPSDTPHMLLQFCQEIAAGMEYLSQKAFVHRDLAARNVLVAVDRSCKISDFGMSRDLENETYYVSQGGKIPVKWTAPEALHFKKYSTASDIWSYGVMMYEIWSIGRKPFQSYSNQDAMQLVNSGVRLPPPPGCPKEIYKLMIHCWHPDTSARPSFTEVVAALSVPETDLLCWSEEVTAIHPQASVLGAPLDASVGLYPELQGTYT